MGDKLTDSMYAGTIITPFSDATFIPIWIGIIVIFAFTTLFMILGIKIFQKKTQI